MLQINHSIYETENYVVFTLLPPHIDRRDGGHIVIACKDNRYRLLGDLSSDLRHELIDLTSACGACMQRALQSDGVKIEMLNYQINGNWSAKENGNDPLHMHIYGRTKSAVNQTFGSALHLPDPETGFYNGFEGLNQNDIDAIRKDLCENESIKQYYGH